MNNIANELILLAHAGSASPEVTYAPTKISTDKRATPGAATTLYKVQIGSDMQHGIANGPVFRVEFVDLSSVTATHIKIWGIDNLTDDAPIYPKTYLVNHPILDVFLRKFEFTDSSGSPVAPGGTYTIVGHKMRGLPLNAYPNP